MVNSYKNNIELLRKEINKKLLKKGFNTCLLPENIISINDGAKANYIIKISDNQNSVEKCDYQIYTNIEKTKNIDEIIRRVNISHKSRGGKVYYHGSNIDFENFDNDYIKELGFHFSSRKQAIEKLERMNLRIIGNCKKGYLYECKLNIKNIYENMPDLGNWDIKKLYSYFKNNNNKIFSDKEWGLIKNEKEFVKAMQKKGFNGISYINQFEHNGDDIKNFFIIFDAKDITICNTYNYKIKCLVKVNTSYTANIKKGRHL